MSTKIYRAYRLNKNSDFWPFVSDTKKRGVEEVQKVLRSLYTSMAGVVEQKDVDAYIERFGSRSESRARHEIAHQRAREGYRDQLGRSERDVFDFDVCIAIRNHKRRIYLIPYCDSLMRKTLDFLDQDPRLDDFAYWNNTDRKEEVSAREWKHRGKIWDEMDKKWQEFVHLDICSWSAFPYVDPYFNDLIQGAKKGNMT
jgi:hypothetical protein